MKSVLVGNTHLVRGTAETIRAILALLNKEGVKTEGNPDMYVRSYASFGIDEARELRDRAILRPMGERRVFVLSMPEMTREAQNALLKTIEEPPANALFFFILSAPDTLLPTVRSRAQMLSIDAEHSVDVKTFLRAVPQQRLDILKPLLEKGEDDKRDVGAVLAFLAALEEAFRKKADPEALRAIYRARRYATDKGALLKPLLEQVALLTPRS